VIPSSEEAVEEIEHQKEALARTVPWFQQFDVYWLEPGEAITLHVSPQVIFRADELRVRPSYLHVRSFSIDNVVAVENNSGTEEKTLYGYDKDSDTSIWSARSGPRNTFNTVTIGGVFRLHVKNDGPEGALVDARLVGRAVRDGS